MFARYVGSTAHPRGRILSAYRQGRLALAQAYGSGGTAGQLRVLESLRTLREDIVMVGELALNDALLLGMESAQNQLEAYQQAGEMSIAAADIPNSREIVQGWRQSVDRQIASAETLVRSGAGLEMLIGDGPSLEADRKGAVQPAPVQRETAFWLATAVSLAFMYWLMGDPRRARPRELRFQKQAIAAIDERTTECCLKVHGQTRPLDGKFKLTGTPRYADYMDQPPFHMYCRTAMVLYLPEYDDGLTGEMEAAAADELAAREEGREEIHPAHARSRRG